MRMNQNEKRFDFHGLGLALKKAREEKGWTQAYLGTRRYQGGIAMSFFLYPNGLLSKKAIIHRRGIPAM